MRFGIGLAVTTLGTLVVLATLSWILLYFSERGLSVTVLKASFGHEFGYWAPVALFAMPGMLMIHHGRRMMANDRTTPIAILESAVVAAVLGIVAAMAWPLNNFSFVAASIVLDGVQRSAPLRTAVEDHVARHGRPPDSLKALDGSPPAIVLSDHLGSIALAEGGRVVVTFDTSDIDWDWSWWHRLLLIESNDLTGLTLVMVPIMEDRRVTWDECAEGTVPKRNRHYRCSAHR